MDSDMFLFFVPRSTQKAAISNYIFGFCTETERAWRAVLKSKKQPRTREFAIKLEPDPSKPGDPNAFMIGTWPDGMVKEITDVTASDMVARQQVLDQVAQERQTKAATANGLWRGVLKASGSEAEMPMRISSAKTGGGAAMLLYVRKGTNESVEWNQKQLLQCLVKHLPGGDDTEKSAAALQVVQGIAEKLINHEITMDDDLTKLRDAGIIALGGKMATPKAKAKGEAAVKAKGKAEGKAKGKAKAKAGASANSAGGKRKAAEEREEDEGEEEEEDDEEEQEEEEEVVKVTPKSKAKKISTSSNKKPRIFETVDPSDDERPAETRKPNIAADILSELTGLFADTE